MLLIEISHAAYTYPSASFFSGKTQSKKVLDCATKAIGKEKKK